MANRLENPNSLSVQPQSLNRAKRRRLIAIGQGAALRPTRAAMPNSAIVRDTLSHALVSPGVHLPGVALPAAMRTGVALREVGQPAVSKKIAQLSAQMWAQTPVAARSAHPIQLIAAHALRLAPQDHQAVLAQLLADGRLSPVQHQAITTQLQTISSRANSALIQPDAFVALLASLPYAVAAAIVQARGKAIQEQLDSWSDDLREQAKLDAEASKRAHDEAADAVRLAKAHQQAVYQAVAVQTARSRARMALQMALLRLAQTSAQPQTFGSMRISSDVPYATPAMRVGGASRSHAVDVDESMAAASLRALGPQTLKPALQTRSSASLVPQRPYSPTFATALAAPSLAAMGPSLRQPAHALEAVSLPGRAVL